MARVAGIGGALMRGSTLVFGSLWLIGALLPPGGAWADDPPAGAARPAPLPERQKAPYGEDVLEPFVPLHPRTTEDRQGIEALEDYIESRALENRREWSDALTTLREALGKEPGSVPIQRRICRLSFLLGRTEQAIEAAKKVLDAEPGDTETLALLVNHYERKNDSAAERALLEKLLQHPKLDKTGAGFLLIERDLGLLYADQLNEPQKAADAMEVVFKALDDKAANDLSLGDQRRILGMDEAATYARIGEIFAAAKRYEQAISAFRRGLVYQHDHPLLPRYLAQTYLQVGRLEEALSTLEGFLKHQPQGREPYELLIQVLERLKRSEEILPRLEAAAKNDPKNLSLQYLLADRYKEAGQAEKATELYRTLLATQPDPQGYGALAASLVKEKKGPELIELLGKAFAKPETLEAVKPQIEALTTDPEYVGKLLDDGLEMMKADPPKLTQESRMVLSYVAGKAKQLDKLLAIQKLALERQPSPQGYREFAIDQYRAGKYAEAAATLEELLAKYPDQRDAQTLALLAQTYGLAGKNEEALRLAEEVLKLDAADSEGLRLKGFLLGKMGRNEEALAHYKAILEKYPDNEDLVRVAHSGLSIVYVNLDQMDQGEKELEILFERDPEDPGVNNDLGYLYADRGKNLEKAEAMIRKAMTEEPENTAYLDSLGWVLFRRGKLEEALEPLQKAARDTGSDATIHDHLGDVLFKLNRYGEARKSWEKAEAISAAAVPPDKRLPEIRRKLDSLNTLDPSLMPPAGAPQP